MFPDDEAVTRHVELTAYRERLDTFQASQDAGAALTGDALHDGITLDALTDAAGRVALYADQALAIVQDAYQPPLHCKEGCSYCCCKPNVLASVPEVVNIVGFVSRTFSVEERRGLRARARRYRAQMQGRRVEDPTDESVPCPLLVDGRCSVYEVRPLICRGYNSTNVDACRLAHRDSALLVPTFALLKDVSNGATIGVVQRLDSLGFNSAMVDLGTALDIAVEAGDRFLQAVVEGQAELAPAENRSWATELWHDVRKTAGAIGVRL